MAQHEVGARIAALRATRHLTQHGLAEAAHVSYSLLTKVESGVRPASPGVVAACARALGVPVHRLTGPANAGPREERLLGLLDPVRAALDLYDLPPVYDARPRPIPALRAAVRRANRLGQAAEYTPMLTELPGLLAELHAAAHAGHGTEAAEAWGCWRRPTGARTPPQLPSGSATCRLRRRPGWTSPRTAPAPRASAAGGADHP